MSSREFFELFVEKNTNESFPNGLKVSETNNPFVFLEKHTYQVGSSSVLAMCSNAKSVGTGQAGSAPLVVFCTDGLYRMFVDSSGDMAYINSRPGPQDVCNNPKSVTQTDMGIVFTTDRGLMVETGADECTEIGKPLEGDWAKFSTATHVDYSGIVNNAYHLEKIAGLPDSSMTSVDFLRFLKHSIINYNHNERELMVSNTELNEDGTHKYNYTYVLDSDGNWSRRDYSANEYVNNYPTSYRLENGVLYQVDEESDADNGMFVLTKELKLDSIGFKELHRVVARGWYKTMENKFLDLYVQGSYDGRKWGTLAVQRKQGQFTDIGTIVERTDCRFFRICLAGKLTKDSRFDYFEISSKASKLGRKIR